MRRHLWLAMALCCAIAAPGVAEPPTLSVNLGAGQVLDSGGGAEGGVELAFPAGWLGIAPAVGGSVSDYGSAYAYLGFRREFWARDRVSVTPFTGAGVYHRGDGINLGGSMQFRSGLELALPLRQSQRLSLSLYHLSNAGLKRPNPGSESVVLGYSFGIDRGSAGRP